MGLEFWDGMGGRGGRGGTGWKGSFLGTGEYIAVCLVSKRQEPGTPTQINRRSPSLHPRADHLTQSHDILANQKEAGHKATFNTGKLTVFRVTSKTDSIHVSGCEKQWYTRIVTVRYGC